MTFWAYLSFHLFLHGLRTAWRVLLWTAVLAASAPVTLVTAIAYTRAWLRSRPPLGPGPLLLVLDCKGGPDAWDKGCPDPPLPPLLARPALAGPAGQRF